MVVGFGVVVSASARALSNAIFPKRFVIPKSHPYQEGLCLHQTQRLLFGHYALTDKTRRNTKAVFLFQPLMYNVMNTTPAGHDYCQRSLFSSSSSKDTNMPSVDEEFRHLDYNQLLEFRNKEKNSVLIDVREKHELAETGVLPNSYHIPLLEVNQALALTNEDFEMLYKFPKPQQQDHVIFSCRSGKRSLAALEKALAQGFINAKHYKGGWLDWEQKTAEPK